MRCKWHYSDEVPGGRYLVPGCISRAVYGDHAICTCAGRRSTRDIEADLDVALVRIKELEKSLAQLNKSK